jgi:hypothetical protein
VILEILFGVAIYLLVGGLVCSTFCSMYSRNRDKIDKICDLFNVERMGDVESGLIDILLWPLCLIALASLTFTLYKFRNINL